MTRKGSYSALLSAVLFGISPVACKAVVGEMSSWLLAGLLYLGSGLGLTGVVIYQKTAVGRTLSGLSKRQWAHLLGAILSGGIAAPLFLAYGIRFGTAAEVSLLLNFEAVATTLLAWIVFHEQIGRRVWIGKILIILASILVLFSGDNTLRLSIPGLSALAACVLWGIDNNLTRELETLPAPFLACIKGWTAGIFNVAISLIFFGAQAGPLQTAGVLSIGALSYGASLVLFIHALREIGSARTSTWFASGPFIGSLLSVLILGERPEAEYWFAALAMLSGMFLLYGEVHRHLHQHEAVTHSHPHEHDQHHRHPHEEADLAGRHDHQHTHEPLTHSHVHWPDIHHRHPH